MPVLVLPSPTPTPADEAPIPRRPGRDRHYGMRHGEGAGGAWLSLLGARSAAGSPGATASTGSMTRAAG